MEAEDNCIVKPSQVYIINYKELKEHFPNNSTYRSYGDILVELQKLFDSIEDGFIPNVLVVPYKPNGWAMFDLVWVNEFGIYYEFKELAS